MNKTQCRETHFWAFFRKREKSPRFLMRCSRGSPAGLPAGLFGSNFYGKTLTAFFSAARKHFCTVFGFHALTETVGFRALLFAGLPRTFHESLQIFVFRAWSDAWSRNYGGERVFAMYQEAEKTVKYACLREGDLACSPT
jgi:hypothetical protein